MLSSTLAIAIAIAVAFPSHAATDRSAARKAASCIMRQDPANGLRLAIAAPASEQEHAAWRAVQPRLSRCAEQPLAQATPAEIDALAGAIAEQFYLSAVDKMRGDPPEDPTRTSQETLAGKEAWPAAARALDCVVMHSFRSSDGLLRSPPGGATEGRLIEEIAAKLPLCVGTGEQVAMSKVGFRTGVARGMMRHFGVPVLEALKRLGS